MIRITARRATALGVAAALVAGLTVGVAIPAQSAEPVLPVADGTTQQKAAASCWEIKQNTPTAPSGVYWLATPALGAPERFYCDQETDGGGWVLVGRGREDWSTSNEGFGTAAQVRDVVTGTGAFAPRQLSADVIEGLLNDQPVSAVPDGVRLRRAADPNGTTWQESRFTFSSPRPDWSWMFMNQQRVGSWRIGTASGSGGSTESFGSDQNLLRVSTTTGSSQGWLYGFGYGSSARGSNTSTTYWWAPSTSAPNPRPFTQVYLRPRLLTSSFAAIPDGGTAAETVEHRASSLAETTVYGVTGLGAGPSSLEGSNEVSAFAESNGVMYVGGNFTSAQRTSGGSGAVSQSYLAAFSVATGELITTFRPTLNNQVKALAALPNGSIAVGGYFTTVNGQSRQGLAVLRPDGSLDTAFSGRLLNYLSGGVPVVRSLDVQGNWLYAGGIFTHSTGGSTSQELYTRSGVRFSLPNGTPDGSWNPSFNGTVISLDASSQGDRTYFAGYFTESNGQYAYKGAALQTTAGATVVPWATRFSTDQRSGYQQAVKEVGDRVWLGGSEHSLFAYDRSTLQTLVDSNITLSGGDFQAISSDGSALYAGCHCFHTNYSDSTTWSNPGTNWTKASKINSIGAWSTTTGDMLPDFSPFLSSRNGAGLWAVTVDSTGVVWAGGDYTASVRSGFVKQWSGGFARFRTLDTTPPPKPSGLAVSTTANGVRVTWQGVSESGVTYEVLRDNHVVATTTGTSVDLAAAPSTTKYFVRAADATGNRSASTNAASASAPNPNDPGDPNLLALRATGWSYWYTGAAPSGSWTAANYTPSGWSTGAAPIGYGTTGVATTLTTSVTPRPITSYYRHAFSVTDASQVASLTVRTRADDGVVLYLNGTEIARRNIDPGTVTPTTYANAAVGGGTASTDPITFTVPGNLVVDGTNVLSAEVHSNYRSTPGHSFDASVTATWGQQPAAGQPADEQPVEDGGGQGGGTGDGGQGGNGQGDGGQGGGTDEGGAAEPVGTVLPTGSDWAWTWGTTEPAAAWRDADFDDSAWAVAPAALGFGNHASIRTQLTTDASPKPVALYFRRSVDLTAAEAAAALEVTTRADDGIVVYINGVEVGRRNVQAQNPTFEERATAAVSTANAVQSPLVLEVPDGLLREGSNVIAVHVLANYRSTPNVSFDLELGGAE